MRSRRKTTHETAREEGSRGAAASENPRCARIPRKSGSAQAAGRSRDLSLFGGCRKGLRAPQRSVPTFCYDGYQRNAPLPASYIPQHAGRPQALPSKSQPPYPNPASEKLRAASDRAFLAGHQWRIEGDTRRRAVPYAATLLVLRLRSQCPSRVNFGCRSQPTDVSPRFGYTSDSRLG